MTIYHPRRVWMLLSLVLLTSAGCCCVPVSSPCSDCGPSAGYAPHAAMAPCDPGNCDAGSSGPGLCDRPLLELLSCRSGCGEVYVDEWTNEPPTADPCGYACGGCGNCRECRPIRNALRLLWGTPFKNCCAVCGPTCDGGCGSGGYDAAGCDCGTGHISPGPATMAPQPIPNAAPLQVAPEAVSTPKVAPEISASAARRLNPALQRQTVRPASFRGSRSPVAPAVYR
jgi:hypothetical protein